MPKIKTTKSLSIWIEQKTSSRRPSNMIFAAAEVYTYVYADFVYVESSWWLAFPY